MNLITELKNITDKYEKDDLEFGCDYYTDYSELRYFLIDKLEKSLMKKKNAKILVKHLDTLLRYTNNTNMDWIVADSLLNNENFMNELMTNLNSFRFPDNISELLIGKLYNWLKAENEDNVKYFFDSNMLNYLADLRLETDKYDSFVTNMSEGEQKQFLNLLVEKKVPITFVNFDFKGNNKQFINDNILYLAKDSNALYALKNTVYDDLEAREKINDYIDANPEQAFASIVYQVRSDAKIEDDNLKDVIEMIIHDVMKNEDAKLSDIKFSGGAYSSVIFIKDKVIKIGTKRVTDKFNNNPYIIKPLLRKELESNGNKCFVEVTERVDTSRRANEEELYQLYKNMRDLGLVWTDVAPKNVGRLIKPNNIHWNGNLDPSNKVLGLGDTVGDAILKNGDLVILDADFIYNENDKDIKYPEKERTDKFEERYKEDKEYDTSIMNTVELFQNFDKEETEEEKRHK